MKKREELWLSPMTKYRIPIENFKKQSEDTNNAIKHFDNTRIADGLRYSYPTGVVKTVCRSDCINKKKY